MEESFVWGVVVDGVLREWCDIRTDATERAAEARLAGADVALVMIPTIILEAGRFKFTRRDM